MSLEYIRNYYKVPAEVGRRVKCHDTTLEGVIVSATHQYINIHFEGDKKPKGPYHPTWNLTYLGMGTVPKTSRSAERYARYRSLSECFDSFAQFLRYEKEERDARKCGFGSVSEYRRWLSAEAG